MILLFTIGVPLGAILAGLLKARHGGQYDPRWFARRA